MKPLLRKILVWIGGILSAVIASMIVYELTLTDPPPSPEPPIYSRGNGQVLFEGVSIPPPQPNVTGPFVFNQIDLDEGEETSLPLPDVSLQVDARELSVNYSFRKAIEAGAVEPDYEDCRSRLDSGTKELSLQSAGFPSGYVCVETNEGRVSVFRISDIHRSSLTNQGGGDHMFNLTLEFEYITWDWE